MDANNILVSVLIINWNKPYNTISAIQSVIDQTYSPIEIVVIDNNSSDDSIQIISEYFPQIKIIKLEKNYGCPGGRNRGISYCEGNYIFFLDDDGILHKDAIKNSLYTKEKFPDAGIIYGKLIDVNKMHILNNETTKHKIYEVGIFQGGLSLHKKDIYKKVGFYPDDYMYGNEELYLSLKLIDNNIKIVRNESIILFHPINNVLSKVDKHKHSFENKLITAYQLFPGIILIPYLCYYPIAYYYYSIKYGFMKDYFKIIWKALKRLKKYNRNPIKISSYFRFLALTKNL